jgi:hypothetical protein
MKVDELLSTANLSTFPSVCTPIARMAIWRTNRPRLIKNAIKSRSKSLVKDLLKVGIVLRFGSHASKLTLPHAPLSPRPAEYNGVL